MKRMSKYPYYQKYPGERVFERLRTIQRLAANEVRTVRNISYLLYPGLHGKDIDAKYNLTIRDVVRARILKMVPWENIREAATHYHSPQGWENVDAFKGHASNAERLAKAYSRDKRPSHRRPIVVVFEKDTVIRQFANVCGKYDIRYVNCGGQLSWTEKNLLATRRLGDNDLILYFGDNDDSGYMIHDVIKRDIRYRGCNTPIEWVALTDEQEERFGQPRHARLDGLNLPDLEMLIEEIVVEYIDLEVYQGIVDQEKEDKDRIRGWTITIEEEDE